MVLGLRARLPYPLPLFWLGMGVPDQLQHEWYRSAPFLISEPDPLHGEEEGSGLVPTFELSSRHAVMCGN